MSPRLSYSRIGFGFLVACCAVVSSHAARAEDETPARALFKQGRALANEGKYAEACPKFEESLRLEVGVGTQFNLADCWEHVGKTASAQKLFLGAAASAKAAGQVEREPPQLEPAAERCAAVHLACPLVSLPRLVLRSGRSSDALLKWRRSCIAVCSAHCSTSATHGQHGYGVLALNQHTRRFVWRSDQM